MSRIRTLLVISALALPVPVVAAGCGGGGGDNGEDPQQVLDQTFNNDTTISSGVLDVTADVSAGDQGSFNFELQGPFQGDPDQPAALPQLDWTATASGEGGGQSLDFSGQLVVTADNAYVVYGGNTYEVGADTFGQFKQAFERSAAQANGAQDSGQTFKQNCEAAVNQAGGDPSVCDIDFTSWLTNLSNDGTSDVEGTSTIQISGDADVKQIVSDFVDIAEQTGGAAAASGIDTSQLDQLEGAIKDAHVDVYSGEDDHLLRKLDFTLSIDPSAIAGATPVPVSSIDVDFAVTLSDVNSDQTISAPAGPTKPITELLSGLSGLGGLGGLPGGSGLGGSSGSSQKYLDCVAKASSASEIQQCQSLL